jgi:protein-S-isoprenylcysteine O-methyltransferase Ste14
MLGIGIEIGSVVTGITLLLTAASKPDTVDAADWLIEPFAYRVGGACLTVLGAALLAWRYRVLGRS